MKSDLKPILAKDGYLELPWNNIDFVDYWKRVISTEEDLAWYLWLNPTEEEKKKFLEEWKKVFWEKENNEIDL